MTTKNLTAVRAAESESDDAFGEMMYRFLMATQRLTLALHALAREEDLGPATAVVEEVTEDLEQIRSDFKRWETAHLNP